MFVIFVMPDVRIPEWEERRLPRQCNLQKGKLLLTQVRAPAASHAVVRGQRAPSPNCYTNLQGVHKQLVAGLSGLVTCLQSNFIGTNFHGLFSSPFVSYWAHVYWLAPGYLMGVGNLTISGEAKTQVQATCHGINPGSLTQETLKGISLVPAHDNHFENINTCAKVTISQCSANSQFSRRG